MQPYNESFFGEQRDGSRSSALQVVPLVLQMLAPAVPQRVLDVGCGVGAWAAAFREMGVPDVRGVDGDYVDRQALLLPADSFTAHDLAIPFRPEETDDLVVCLEVGEHLPPKRAESLVDDLTRLAPVVLFSAAVPGQGGVAHVNEQWPDYWAALFKQRGYRAVDCLRRRVWDNPRVRWWYAQNMLLYVRENRLADYPQLQQELRYEGVLPLRLVHPGMYAGLRYFTDPQTMGMAAAWGSFRSAVSAACGRRLHRVGRGAKAAAY
jgi:SAM-dependent methyltransferase